MGVGFECAQIRGQNCIQHALYIESNDMLRIYLDNCCFNRPYDDQSQLRIKLEAEAKMRVQEYVLAHQVELVWSYILAYENAMNPFEAKRTAIAQWQARSIIDLDATDHIVQYAKQLKTIGLRSKDATHISCAIAAQCAYFLTTDDRILNKSTLVHNIKIIDPIGFIKEFEK